MIITNKRLAASVLAFCLAIVVAGYRPWQVEKPPLFESELDWNRFEVGPLVFEDEFPSGNFYHPIHRGEDLSDPDFDWRSYIPDIPGARGLYDTYIAMGKEPIEAAIEVLRVIVGEDEQE